MGEGKGLEGGKVKSGKKREEIMVGNRGKGGGKRVRVGDKGLEVRKVKGWGKG